MAQNQPQTNDRVKVITSDPDFFKLSPEGRQKTLAQIHPAFRQLSPEGFSQVLEGISPEQYAIHERGVKPPLSAKDMKEQPFGSAGEVGLIAANADQGIRNLSQKIQHPIDTVFGIQDKIDNSNLHYNDIWKAALAPFDQLTNKSEFGQLYQTTDGKAILGKEAAADGFKALNFMSAFMGGDPDEAWRKLQKGETGAGLADLSVMPIATSLGSAALKFAGPLAESSSPALTTSRQGENLASLIGISRVEMDPITGIARDSKWVADTVKPLINQALSEEGFYDTTGLQRIGQGVKEKFTGPSDPKSIQGSRGGAFPGGWVDRLHKKENVPQFDAVGNPIGETVSNLRRGARKVLNISDRAVDIADRPFSHILQEYGKESATEITPSISGRLITLAAEEDRASNHALASALRARAHDISQARTLGELNDIKIAANKHIKNALNSVPGKTIGATADSVYAWKVAADSIREDMYPALQKMSGINLRDYGARESAAIRFRDGVYSTYFNRVDPGTAGEVAAGYLGKLEHGSLAKPQVAKKLLGVAPSPAAEFNMAFRKGVGKIGKGQVPEKIETVMKQQKLLPASTLNSSSDMVGGAIDQASQMRTAGINAFKEFLRGDIDKASYATKLKQIFPTATPEDIERLVTRATIFKGDPLNKNLIANISRAVGSTELLDKPIEGAKPVFRIHTTLPQEVISPIETSTSKVYQGTKEVPNPSYEPFEASSHKGREVGGDPDYTKDQYTPPKERKKEIGEKGSITPDRMFTGEPTKKETQWQLISESKGGEVSREGGGVMMTDDPKVAAQTLKRIKDFVASPQFKTLPREQQEAIQLEMRSLDKQMSQYTVYAGKKAPRSVTITPMKPGIVKKNPWVKRAALTKGAGVITTAEGQDMRERIDETQDKLDKERKAGVIPRDLQIVQDQLNELLGVSQ